MRRNLQIQIAENDQDWDSLIGTSGSLFHYSDWVGCVNDTLGGASFKIVICSHNFPIAALTVFQGGAWSSGMDFRIGAVGYGGPLLLNATSQHRSCDRAFLREVILALEEHFQGCCVGIRGVPIARDEVQAWGSYGLTHILPLDTSLAELFETTVEGSIRTAIRKAKKSNLSVQRISSEMLPQAHCLIEDTQRAVGSSYTTSRLFLEGILKLSRNILPLFLGAFLDQTLCAASLFLISRRESFHLLNGWSREFSSLCPNQLLLWEALSHAKSNASPIFNFGESGYESLAIAKAKWGALPHHVLNLGREAVRQILI